MMLNNIPKLNGATDKLGDWAERFAAAKSALFNKSDEDELDFDFSINRLNVESRRNEQEVAEIDLQHDLIDPSTTKYPANTEIEDRTVFLNNRVKENILAKWELQGENGPNEDFISGITSEDYDDEDVKAAPLLMGYNRSTDYVELEYMSVEDPETGYNVAPVVKILPSGDNTTDNIYLNGKLVASVARNQNIDASDVRLVKIDG
jgi:hypothetical protein